MSVLRWLLGAGVVVAVPLMLAFGSTHVVLYDPGTYQYGFDRYAISRRTGLTPAELQAATASFINYFAGRGELDVTIERGGRRVPLFNDRELRHMVDVRQLFWLCDRLAAGSALYLALFAAVGFATRRLTVRRFAWLLFGGSAATFGVGILFALASMLDFETLFLQFHLMSFDNDTWMLDPSRDYLIAMFPEPFWLDCALRIAAMALGGAAAIAAGSVFTIRATGPRRTAAPGDAAAPRPGGAGA